MAKGLQGVCFAMPRNHRQLVAACKHRDRSFREKKKKKEAGEGEKKKERGKKGGGGKRNHYRQCQSRFPFFFFPSLPPRSCFCQ